MVLYLMAGCKRVVASTLLKLLSKENSSSLAGMKGLFLSLSLSLSRLFYPFQLWKEVKAQKSTHILKIFTTINIFKIFVCVDILAIWKM